MPEWNQRISYLFKQRVPKFWKSFKSLLKRVFPFLAVVAIVAGAWFAFFSIVTSPPIDTTPALIMVWVSVVVILSALFPSVLERIKKIKVMDFELELQDAVAAARSDEYISIDELDDRIFSTKGGLRNLADIMELVIRFPTRHVLLAVNLRNGHHIFIPVLFIYLFFLDLLGASVTVIFVNSRRKIKKVSDIRDDDIVGAISGKKVLQSFLIRFPRLYRIFDSRGFNEDIGFEELFRGGVLSGRVELERLLSRLLAKLLDHEKRRNDYLSVKDVENWFRFDLNTHAVKSTMAPQDVQEIRKAIVEGNELLLVFSDDGLESVISICALTRDVASKAIQELDDK